MNAGWSLTTWNVVSFFPIQIESTAFIEAVLLSVTQWLKHGTVTVRTKTLIIHFLPDKSPTLKPQMVPALDEKHPPNVTCWCEKITNSWTSLVLASALECSQELSIQQVQTHMSSPPVHWQWWEMDLINYRFKCDLSCLILGLISCLCVLCGE